MGEAMTDEDAKNALAPIADRLGLKLASKVDGHFGDIVITARVPLASTMHVPMGLEDVARDRRYTVFADRMTEALESLQKDLFERVQKHLDQHNPPRGSVKRIAVEACKALLKYMPGNDPELPIVEHYLEYLESLK